MDQIGHGLPTSELWEQAADSCTRWLAGEDAGLDELVALMTPVLWHVVRSYRLGQAETQDVIQTTWLALVRSRGSIRDTGGIGGWLSTAARREAWRVTRAHGRVEPTEDSTLALRLPAQRSAEEVAVGNDVDAHIWDALHRLDPRCQRLLRIVAFEHRPDYRALADDLDMPVGSIGPTRGRCLEKLKRLLVAEGTLGMSGQVTREEGSGDVR